MTAIGHVAAALHRAGVSAAYPELPAGRLEQFPKERSATPADAPSNGWSAAMLDIERLAIPGGLPDSVAEQYRRIAAALHQAQRTRQLRVLMVTSAVAGEGKTLTAANVALTLSAAFHRRVLLVDADLRRPMMHTLFGIPGTPGLIDALRSGRSATADLPVVRISPALSVLTAGRPEQDSLGRLASPALGALLSNAADRHDWVVVDTPPAMLLSETRLLADTADGTLLVLRADATQHPIVARAIELIGRERIVGVVLNGAERRAVHAAYGGDYYEHYARRSRGDRPSVSTGAGSPSGDAV